MLTRYLKTQWYPLAILAALSLPALVCQTVVPVVPYAAWESMSESVYGLLLRYQKPSKEPASRVVVLEVDQKTLDTYGWPIDRAYYVALLERLEKAGHPWLLSLLQFQALDRAKAAPNERAYLAARDAELEKAVKHYGRYVGTGLRFEAGAELSPEAEETLMPRVTLTRSGQPVDELPYLPLNLMEDERFVGAQAAFGFGTHFGLSPMIRCMQMYVTDAEHSGAFVIPSSLAWVTSLANDARITTQSGVTSPAGNGEMRLGYKQCLTSPGILTRDYLARRGVERESLATFLDAKNTPDLTGKIVILARSDMRRFRGPGSATDADDGVIEEHLLAARFLDGLLTGDSIRREDLSHLRFMAWLPVALAAGLLLVAVLLSPFRAILVALSVLGILVAAAAFNLTQGEYLMPLEAMTSVAATAALLGMLYVALRYHAMRREVRLADGLRKALASCNTLSDVERGTRQVWRVEFPNGAITFGDYDKELYDAVSDPKALLHVLEARKRLAKPAETSHTAPLPERPRYRMRLSFRARSFQTKLLLSSPAGFLGSLALSLAAPPHEQRIVETLVSVLTHEVAEHWHRIKMLVDQKILDYKFLAEQSRVDILERFLTKVLVARFSDALTMAENLAQVLTPRPTRAALFQADIRGYSRVSANMDPQQMVRLLQSYFRHVVDAASAVAQVKLIGDCIFLFIEEQAASADASPADLALDLASILIRETRAQNKIRAAQGGEELNFGIAIHYGEVVVGNLSSDSCIDYTVISANVNQVARMEELTKTERVAAAVGKNGVIMSNEAVAALIKYKGVASLGLDLAELGAAVRSFASVKTVQGFTAETVLALTVEDEEPRKAG